MFAGVRPAMEGPVLLAGLHVGSASALVVLGSAAGSIGALILSAVLGAAAGAVFCVTVFHGL